MDKKDQAVKALWDWVDVPSADNRSALLDAIAANYVNLTDVQVMLLSGIVVVELARRVDPSALDKSFEDLRALCKALIAQWEGAPPAKAPLEQMCITCGRYSPSAVSAVVGVCERESVPAACNDGCVHWTHKGEEGNE